MAKSLITYILLLFLVVSCNEENATLYTIHGHANNLESDIFVFGLDSRLQKTDSIKADKHGNFSYSIKCDTIVPFMMIMPDGKQVTLFAEGGVKAKLSYDCIKQECLISNCGPVQMLHDSITQIIEDCPNEKKRLDEIEKFIIKHPVSEVNIELLRRYLINVPDPNYQQIKNFISKLGGILQDNEYLAITKKKIDEKSGNTIHKQFPSFTYQTADSCKEITLSTFNKKHLLVTLWASWDEESRMRQRELIAIKEKYKEHNFDILSVSLDTDRQAWLQAIAEDSVTWRQANDFDGWDTSLAQRMQIDHLPANMLLNTARRIQATDIYGEELDKRIGELTKPKKEEKKPVKKTPTNIRAHKLKQ